MIKFAPIRVARSLSSEAQFKGGAIAVSAIKQSAPQVVHNTPASVASNGIVKFLSSMIVAVVKPFSHRYMRAIGKKITPIAEEQSVNTLKTVKKCSESLSNSYLETTQKIGSGFNGFVENFKKSAERKFKNFSNTTREKTSEIKGFADANESKKIAGNGEKAVRKVKKETNFFDRLFKREKNTIQEKPINEKKTLKSETPKKTRTPKTSHSKKHSTPKSELTEKSSNKTVNSEKNLKPLNPEQKTLGNKKDVLSKTVEQQKHHTNTAKISGKNPFAEVKLSEIENPKSISNLEKTASEMTTKATKRTISHANTVANPFAVKSNSSTSPNSKIKVIRRDIRLIKAKIIIAEQSNQNTELLKAELAKKEISLAKLVKSAKKKNIKLGQKIKTNKTKKYRKLSKNNYVGHKSFDSIKGKGGLFRKEQYSPDGKLERTVINKGKGLIEIREANSNKIYYMRDGITIEKSALEAQEDTMKRLAHVLNVANKTESQALIRSYAKKCGMKEVNKRIMIDGKTTNIIYEGFGYSITSDGMVLSKKFSYGNNVFYSDISAGSKRAEHKKA